MPPHVFEVAERCFQEARRETAMPIGGLGRVGGSGSLVVVAGDCGAGKSTAARRVLEYLSFAAGRQHQRVSASASSSTSTSASASSSASSFLSPSFSLTSLSPVDVVLRVGRPLLAAMGNASTARHDDSSRFGTLTELSFGPTVSQSRTQ